MKNTFEIVIRARFYKIILILLGLATLYLTYLFFNTTNDRYAALLGGVASGLFVAFIQFLIDLNEHNDIEKIKRLGIRNILPYREGKEYYEELINEAREQIWVLGNTAQRFLLDFASEGRPDCRSLLDALGRGVEVRILLPEAEFLSDNDKALWVISSQRMKQLSATYPNFKFRYFGHLPSHSIVKVDDEMLIGPVFRHVSSKDSPAVHINARSPFVKEYITHFEEEWANAASV